LSDFAFLHNQDPKQTPQEFSTPRVSRISSGGLRELGYIEDSNIEVKYRWAEKPEQFSTLAAERVALTRLRNRSECREKADGLWKRSPN
jgi:hypothetical protein